jgi:hypothetical protein
LSFLISIAVFGIGWAGQALSLTGHIVWDAATLKPPTDPTTIRVSVVSEADAQHRAQSNYYRAPATLPPPVSVAADGTFIVSGLAPGRYEVSLERVPVGWWARSAIYQGKDVLDIPLEIGTANADLAPLVITLSDRHTGLSGTVAMPANRPMPSLTVVAFSTDPSLRRAHSRRVKTARVGADGRYALRDLPPGDFFVAAVGDFAPSNLTTPSFFDRLANSSSKVTLAEGEQKTVDLHIGG